jgi:HrpA-like RNA helicase
MGGRRRARVGPGGAVVSSLSTRAGGVIRNQSDLGVAKHDTLTSTRSQDSETAVLDPVRAYKERKAAARRQQTTAKPVASESAAAVAVDTNQRDLQKQANGSSKLAPIEKTTPSQRWLGATPRLLLQEWMQRAGWRGQPRIEPHTDGVWRVRLGKGHVSGNAQRPVPVYYWKGIADLGESGKPLPEEQAASLAALWVLASVDRERNHTLRLDPSLRPYWDRFVMEHQARDEQAKRLVAQTMAAQQTASAEAKAAFQARLQQITLRLSERTRVAVEEALVLLAHVDTDLDTAEWTPTARAEHLEIVLWLRQQLEQLGFNASISAYAASLCSRRQGAQEHPREYWRAQALDWLCLHLDENELPPLFQPERATEVVTFGRTAEGDPAVSAHMAIEESTGPQHQQRAIPIVEDTLPVGDGSARARDITVSGDHHVEAGLASRTPVAQPQSNPSLQSSRPRIVQLDEPERQTAIDWLVDTMVVMSRTQAERLLLANDQHVLDAANAWIRELVSLSLPPEGRRIVLNATRDVAACLKPNAVDATTNRWVNNNTTNDLSEWAKARRREQTGLEATFGESLCWTNVLSPTLLQPASSLDQVSPQGFQIDLRKAVVQSMGPPGFSSDSHPWSPRLLCGHFYRFPRTLPMLWLDGWSAWRPPRYLRRCWLRVLHQMVEKAMTNAENSGCTQTEAVLAPSIQTWLLGWWQAGSPQAALPMATLRPLMPSPQTSLRPEEAKTFANQPMTDRQQQGRSSMPLCEANAALDALLQQREQARIAALHRTPKKPWLLLPARQAQQQFLEVLESGTDPLLIQAETGSGKTTQCPAMILENALLQGRASRTFILVTQPRRIAAIAVAQRVAYERGEVCRPSSDTEPHTSPAAGDTRTPPKPALVGYQVRLRGQRSKHTRLLFCTTGIVLRMLQEDPQLSKVSHLVVDEVHERHADTDLLLCCARSLLRVRPDLQVILMSATAKATEWEDYWQMGPQPRRLRVLNIPGRSFPVEIRWLEDLGDPSREHGAPGHHADASQSHDSQQDDLQDHGLVTAQLGIGASTTARQQADSRALLSPKHAVSHSIETAVAIPNALRKLQIDDRKRADADEDARSREHALPEETSSTSRCRLPSIGEHPLDPTIQDENQKRWRRLGFSPQHGASLALVESVIRRLDIELAMKERGQPPQHPRGAILVFLAGIAETEQLCRRLRRVEPYHRPVEVSQLEPSIAPKQRVNCFWALALHANQTLAQQEQVFASVPCSGEARKVICATNIAESSITVPDVVAVIDTCRVRSPYIQQAELSALQLRETWCSKASAMQRAGRAGRVSAGICWRLIPREPTWKQELLDAMPPELSRTPLERWLLWLLSWPQPHDGTRRSLAQAVHLLATETVTAPPQAHIEAAVRRLWRMGALTSPYPDKSEHLSVGGPAPMCLTVHRQPAGQPEVQTQCYGPTAVDDPTWTPLGRILATMPLDPVIGKLLVLGAVFGCLSWSLTAAAVLIEGSPFQRITNNHDPVQQRRVETYGPLCSDVSSAVYAWQQWMALQQRPKANKGNTLHLLEQYALSERTLECIRQTRSSLQRMMLDMGLGLPLEDTDWHEHETHTRLHRAVLFAALYPHLVRVASSGATKYVSVQGGHMEDDETSLGSHRLYDEHQQRVWLHPSSIIYSDTGERLRSARWLTYAQRLATARAYIQHVTCVPVFAVLLFSGHDMVIEHEKQQVLIDGWVRFRCAARTAVLLRAFRQQTDALLSSYFAYLVGDTSGWDDSNWSVLCQTLRTVLVKLVAYD